LSRKSVVRRLWSGASERADVSERSSRHSCQDVVNRWCVSGTYDSRELAGSAAPSVGLAAVVRLGPASAELASFCLCHSAISVPVETMYLRLNLLWESGALDGVVAVSGFTDRLLGIRRPDVSSVLLWTSSVHTFGLKDPIRVVTLTDDGVVAARSIVPPRRVHRRSGRGWILEMSTSIEAPPLGTRIIALPSHHVRNLCPVRNADRQSR
jgi:hypothetical protein